MWSSLTKTKSAVGCGAFKEFEPKIAEIKRMYVRENMRGRGIAGKILAELETLGEGIEFFGVYFGNRIETTRSY